MANMQNNAKDAEKYSVNTRGIQLLNKEGFDPSTLSIGYWKEDFITLRINPALEKSKQTPTKVFDYDKTVSTAMSLQIARTLLYGIETLIIPAVANKTDKSVSVQVGGDTLITVGTGVSITNAVRPYIAIHKSINPETKKPDMSIYYEFNRGFLLSDYNVETGKYNMLNDMHNELLLFVDIIKAAIIGMSKAGTHANRVVNRALNDKITGSLTAIGEKVGASMPTSSYSYNRNTNNVRFSSNDDTSSESDSIIDSLNNISDIDSMLG